MEKFWDATLYDNKHAFVSKYGNEVMEWLEPSKTEQILDLGCGTGDIAKDLHDAGVQVKGIDSSENMIIQARQKYPALSFDVADATMLPFEEEFDAVFSNAVLHWVKRPEAALKGIYRALKHGGRFIAEFGGKGNVQTITEEIKKEFMKASIPYEESQFPWYFPSIGEYTMLMEKAGFRVTYAIHFDRPTQLEGTF